MIATIPVDVLVIADPQDSPEQTILALHDQAGRIKTAVVSDGNTAEHFLANCKVLPKVILLDMQLPDMDGIELLRRIRSSERTKSVPVLMLTDPGNRTRKIEARTLSVSGYIPKVVDGDVLADQFTIFRHLVAAES